MQETITIMALNKLRTVFRQITIGRQSNIIGKYFSSHPPRKQNDILTPHFPNNAIYVTYPETYIKFAPGTLNIDFVNSNGATNKNIIETPFKNIPPMEEPLTQHPVYQDLPLVDKSLELPTIENVLEKLAARLVKIRRQKMKKHKRRKLRRLMKHKWEQIRQKRNILKEKVFQAELLTQIKKAEAFDPKVYIEEKLAFLHKERIPFTFRGEILPKHMVKQFRAEKAAQKERRRNKFRLKLD